MDQSNSQTPAVDGRDVEVADEPETGGQEAAGSEGGEMEDIKIEQVGDEEGPSKSMKDSLTSFVKADGRPVQWIYDRCNGHERVMDPNSKPCCCLMFPNGFLKLAPGLLESNPFMECFGRVGFMRPEWFKLRRVIFGIAMIFSTIGWTSMLLTDLAISDSYHILKSFHFSKGDVNYIFGGPNGTSFVNGDTTIYVGLRAVGWSRTFLNITSDEIDRVLNASVTLEESDFAALLETFRVREQTVSSFGDFCDGDNGVWFVESDQCDSCEKASTKMIRSIIMATTFYFFTFKNDWLRFWVNYDVNCQKFMSVFVACITVGLALNTFFRYRNECFNSFREGENCFYGNGTTVDCPRVYTAEEGTELTDEDFADISVISWSKIDWDAGPCYILLGCAVFIRLFSMICNLSVPTPPITRDRQMQWEYERIAHEEDKKTPNLKASEYFVPW